jgi:hypothetical protein
MITKIVAILDIFVVASLLILVFLIPTWTPSWILTFIAVIVWVIFVIKKIKYGNIAFTIIYLFSIYTEYTSGISYLASGHQYLTYLAVSKYVSYPYLFDYSQFITIIEIKVVLVLAFLVLMGFTARTNKISAPDKSTMFEDKPDQPINTDDNAPQVLGIIFIAIGLIIWIAAYLGSGTLSDLETIAKIVIGIIFILAGLYFFRKKT